MFSDITKKSNLWKRKKKKGFIDVDWVKWFECSHQNASAWQETSDVGKYWWDAMAGL